MGSSVRELLPICPGTPRPDPRSNARKALACQGDGGEARMRKVGLVFDLGLLLLTAGCARIAESPSRSPGPTKGPATFTVGPQDSGATITMHIGDHLVFAPHKSTSTPSGLAWTVLRYPGNLAITSDG